MCERRAQSVKSPGSCNANASVGNPIHAGTGNKYQQETDYVGTGTFPLQLTRSYNSAGNPAVAMVGTFWRTNYDRSVRLDDTNPNLMAASVYRPDGSMYVFAYSTGSYSSADTDISHRLVNTLDAAGVRTGWKYTSEAVETELYDLAGKLLSITNRAGLTQTLSYSDATTPTSIAPRPGLLIQVTDPFGRTLNFTYDAAGKLATMIDPAGQMYRYSYNTSGMLAAVSYPDATPAIPSDNPQRIYHYENPDFPGALTGISDENGQRFSTWTYDSLGRAISSEHAGGVGKTLIAYNADGSSTVTDFKDSAVTPNASRVYTFQSVLSATKTTAVSQPCATCGGGSAASYTYDADGNIASKTDFNGNLTCYSYDSSNLENRRAEGLSGGTCPADLAAWVPTANTLQRKISTTWVSTYRLPISVYEPNRKTDYSTSGCGVNGVICSKTEYEMVDPNGGLGSSAPFASPIKFRAWAYTYSALGQMLTSNGPRTDVNDVTTYTYYASNDAAGNYRTGDLSTVTNALGHVTTISAYDAHGRPKTITDANGLVTQLSYTPRGWLTSRNVGGETTSYEYDGVGQLTKVTMADGSFLTYTYDGAHRLTQIQDGLGNKVVYTLDLLGNRTAENYTDPAGALSRTRTRVYDALSRLQQDIGGSAQTTLYGYDANGNQTSITDPLSRTTGQVFDALNRLIQVNDANTPSGATKYEYDAQDNLTKVTDAKNLATTYTYNGFKQLISQTSPDTGTTTFTYDRADNMLTKTDARGVTVTYTYDALNRVTTINYPAYQTDPAETVTYTYDTCANGKGRLCSLADKTGTTTYAYDQQGRVTSKAQTIAGLTQTISYRYNSVGQMDEMTLPSGKKVAYGYLNNRIVNVTYDGTKPIVKNADYEPFGPIGEWTWGNDTPAAPNKHIRYFDLDGRTTKIESGTGNIQPTVIVYDAAARITALQKLTGTTVDTAKSNTYGYDNLDRLTTITPGAGNPQPARAYTYDAIGNRLSQTTGSATTSYSYGTTSHWLNALTGATSKTYTHDAAGNRIADGIQSWIYGANNRPIAVTLSGTTPTTVQTSINALGQRVAKTVNGVLTRYVYDEGGRLVGEYTNTGQPLQETLWFNDLPVAVIK